MTIFSVPYYGKCTIYVKFEFVVIFPLFSENPDIKIPLFELLWFTSKNHLNDESVELEITYYIYFQETIQICHFLQRPCAYFKICRLCPKSMV